MRPKRLLTIIFSLIWTAACGGWASVKFVLDSVGRVGELHDMVNASTMPGKALLWLFSTPSWVPALITILTILLWTVVAYKAIATVEGVAISAAAIKPNTTQTAISLETGPGDKFDHLQVSDNGYAIRTVSLKFTNVGNGQLSTCQVWLRSSSQPIDRGANKLMFAEAHLIHGQYRFFAVARFFERHLGTVPEDEFIQIMQHYGGGFAPAPIYITPAPKDKPTLLTLEATADECSPSRVQLKLYVTQPDRRLHLELA